MADRITEHMLKSQRTMDKYATLNTAEYDAALAYIMGKIDRNECLRRLNLRTTNIYGRSEAYSVIARAARVAFELGELTHHRPRITRTHKHFQMVRRKSTVSLGPPSPRNQTIPVISIDEKIMLDTPAAP